MVKHTLLFREFATRISSGELCPGARLPSEIELARRYKLSRSSVREGLARLRDRGLIERRRGSGSYVSTSGDPTDRPQTGRLILIRAYVDFLNAQNMDPWFSSLREELVRAAATHQLALAVETVFPGSVTVAQTMNNMSLAGIAVVPVGGATSEELLEGTPHNVPRVVINRPSSREDISGFYIDHTRGAFDAVSLLLRIGHRRIVLLAPPYSPNDQLRDGYVRAHREAGVPLDPRLDLVRNWQECQTNWHKEIIPLLSGPNRATAVFMNFCASPTNVIERLAAAGFRVPQDVSFIMQDDDDSLEETSPSLSGVAQPLGKMCRLAVDTIARLARGDTVIPANHPLRPKLIIRDSVAGPRP